jgi:TonB dependent receptor-like, beta-barrel/CarboxypepD_reg-like domain/TonB-dependent Receptor Plug Domain
MKWIIFLVCMTFVWAVSAQKHTISGHIKDDSNGESLIGASIYVDEIQTGTTTNTYGFYSLTLPEGTYNLVITFVGFEKHFKEINLTKDITYSISLEAKSFTKETFVITAEKADQNTKSTDMGKFEIPIEKVKVLPAFMGEVDILKTIQLTPGVQSAGEGSSGFYVRGGGPDQNLILLDEAVVYNASHLFGFFSVFNADALKNVELTKAGMPANYGGRLASVLDISMKEGNNKKYEVDGGIGLISSRLTVQGPIKKDTSSFIISGRRTYADLLIKPFVKKDSPLKETGYYFYDLNAKVNYTFNENNRVFASGYFGRDVFNMSSSESSFSNSMEWGNATATIRWNHLFNSKLFFNTSMIYSNYDFSFGMKQADYDMKLVSGIEDWNAKMDFTYLPGPAQTIKFGVNYIFHTFTPNNATAKTGGVEIDLGEPVKLYSHDLSVYVNDNFNIGALIKVNAGLRYTFFQQIGPFDRYIKDAFGQTIDTIHYDKNKPVATYNHIEPRLSMRYLLTENSSIKAAFTQNYQYIHLASVTSINLPTDIWVPCSDVVKPQFATQYSVGYYHNFHKNMFETSLEVYYKEMENLIEFGEGALMEDNMMNNTDNNFVFGDGQSYGVELFLKKRTGKTTGWIGYTLSKTTRDFPELNGGETFYAKYDRKHDISFVITHELNEKWIFSLVWVYATGNTMTLPVSRYIIEGNIVSEYGDKNAYRMPAYHRMDISATWQLKKTKRFESSLNFSVYNLYNRKNPYYIYFETVGDVKEGDLEVKAKQVSLFPVLPSITWNFKF